MDPLARGLASLSGRAPESAALLLEVASGVEPARGRALSALRDPRDSASDADVADVLLTLAARDGERCPPALLDVVADRLAGGHTRALVAGVLEAHDVASAHEGTITALLSASSPALRARAVRVATLVGGAARARLAERLESALGTEGDPSVIATFLVALALTSATDDARASIDRCARHPAPRARLGARLARVLAEPERESDDEDLELLETIEKERSRDDVFPFFEGELSNAGAVWLARSAARRQRGDLLGLLVDAAKGLPTRRLVAMQLLGVVLGPPPGAMAVPAQLTAPQRAMLEALLRAGLVADIPRALEAHGLFGTERALRQSLGLAAPLALDASIDGAPLWHAIVEHQSGRLDAETLLDRVRRAGVAPLDLALEAVRGPYPLQLPYPRSWPEPIDAADRRFGELVLSMAHLTQRLVDAPVLEAAASDAAEPAVAALLACALAEARPASAARLLPTFLTHPRYRVCALEVLASLPLADREAFVSAIPLDHFVCDDPFAPGRRMAIARGGWDFVEVCPTPGMLDRVLDAIARWQEPPWPRTRAAQALDAVRGELGPVVDEALVDRGLDARVRTESE